MGLFKALKKAVKSVIKGVGKVFKAVLKPFAKLLNNKFVRGALMAVSLFTGGAALLGAFKAGGLKAAGNFILKKAVEIVTLPIDLAAKGLGAIGSITGSEGLKGFAETISNGLGELANKAGNVFQADTNSIASQFAENAGVSGTPDNPVMNVDSALEQTATMPDGLAAPPSNAPVAVAADAGGQPGFSVPGMDSPAPANADWAAPLAPGQKFATTASSGTTGAGKSGGVMDWINRNAEGLKFVTDAVGAFTSTNQYEDYQKSMEDQYQFIDSQFAPYATTGYGGNPVPPRRFERLRQRNAAIHSRADQSRARLGLGGSV